MFKLLYPLRYFRLRNKEKRLMDIIPSLILALVISSPYVLLDGASFFRVNGFLDKTLTLTSALTGFYVASLVAAATFSHPDLDKVIRSGAIALLDRDEDGNRIVELLTRREFACYIFGYLSFASLAISIASAFLVSISGVNLANISVWFAAHDVDFPRVWECLRGCALFSMSVAMSHLLVATTLGLYYLMDRLYRHDRQVISKKSDLVA